MQNVYYFKNKQIPMIFAINYGSGFARWAFISLPKKKSGASFLALRKEGMGYDTTYVEI